MVSQKIGQLRELCTICFYKGYHFEDMEEIAHHTNYADLERAAYGSCVCNICAATSKASTSGFLPDPRALSPRVSVVRLGDACFDQEQLVPEWNSWGKLRQAELY
jgi:hypothetical protein